MGTKISIELFRAKAKLGNVVGRNQAPVSTPKSVWYVDDKSYASVLLQDHQIREFLFKRLYGMGVAKIEIKRVFRKLEIAIHTTKPGLIIGKGGSLINELKQDLLTKLKLPADLKLSIIEFRDPNRSANVIAEDIAGALVKRVPYRKVVKNYLERVRYSGVLGCKIKLSGRLNGVDIARSDEFGFGSVPRHTIDAQIDYSLVHAQTQTGTIGVKVFLYLGDKITNYTM